MKCKVVFFLLCCFVQSVFSQTDYRKGFLITNKGDSIHGLINYKVISSMHTSFDFKKSLDAEKTTYLPTFVREYGFDKGKHYRTQKIVDDEQGSQLLFFEVLVEGSAILYKLNLEYYIEKKAELIKLENDRIDIEKYQNIYRKNTNRYIGILTVLLSDCPVVKKKIAKIKYREKSLTQLIENYNACIGNENESYKKEKKWVDFSFGVSGGISISTYNFTDQFQKDIHFSKKTNPSQEVTFGAFLEITSPRTNERISYIAGLYFLSNKYVDAQETVIGTTRKFITDAEISFERLKIPIGIKYTFSKNNFSPYLATGISNDIILSSKNRWTEEEEIDNTVYTTSYSFTSTPFSLGYWATAGIRTAIDSKINAFLEFKFDYSIRANDDALTRANYNNNLISYQFLIGFNL